jgi:hypothetical protein
MISLRKTSLGVAGALLLTGLSPVYASSATKHPKPKHPEAVHEKPQHPARQKGTKHTGPKATRHSARKVKGHKRGQAAIDNQRAQEIQQALVREHYLNGEPTGTWDSSTQEAMRRYQADQGWQTKQVPDSRALIRLGLGPDHGHLLNPESAMTTSPRLSQSASNTQPAAPYAKAPVATQSGTRINTPAAAMPQISPSR